MSTRKVRITLEIDLETGHATLVPDQHRPLASGAAGSVDRPAAPLWGAPSPPPSPANPPPPMPCQETTPLRVPFTRNSASIVAWARLVEDLADGKELWSGFVGLGPQEVLTCPDVLNEIRCLQLRGVSNAHEMVLRYGPRRCKQVRVWTEKLSRKQQIRNPGGLIVRTLCNGSPKEPSSR
jgi:hypothetical protein